VLPFLTIWPREKAVEQHHIVRTTRRTILTGVAATLLAGARAAQAQQHDAMRRLGVLMGAGAADAQGQKNFAALVQGLAALGWKEGGNLRIDWRRAGGNPTLFERYAAELIALDPDVLLAPSAPALQALRRQTSMIPIVFALIADPVGLGFVASMARPGGNITGFSAYDPPMAGKWLQMLTQITPPVAHVAVLYNPGTAPYAGLMMQAIEAAAASLAVTVQAAPIHDEAEIETMMAALAREPRSGLLIIPELFNNIHRAAIVALAGRYRLPAVYPFGFFATAGGLVSYGIDQSDLFQRAATYVDRIFKGAKPGDLPVQAPSKFETVINLKTAKALGVTIAPPLLATADKVID
jgi:putative tryptophan/tyrosine transport system substrate-binding protein